VLVAAAVLAGCGEDEPGVYRIEPGPLTVDGISGPELTYLGEEACFSAAHSAGPDAVLDWSFGDGEKGQSRGAEPACHVYAEPGHLLLAVSVAAGGEERSASRALLAVPKPLEPAPRHSSTIVYDAERERVWVVNPDADSVSVIAADPPALVKEIPVGKHPRTLAVSGDRIAVTCQGSDELALIDAGSLALQETVSFAAGTAPYGVVALPGGTALVVTLQGTGELAVVDPEAAAIVSLAPIGADARGIAARADGQLLVSRWRATVAAAEVFHVDAADAKNPALVASVPLPADTNLDSDTNNNGVPGFQNQVLFAPDGGRAILPSLKANTVSGVFRSGDDLTFELTARAILTIVEENPAGGFAERSRGRHAFDDLDYASSAVFSPEGGLLYVAFQGSERILALDAFSFDVAGSILEAGRAPQGLALSPDGERLYVDAFLSRSVRVFDVSKLRSGLVPVVADIETVQKEPLSPEVLEGKRIFYAARDPRMSRSSYLSCASCHLDGEGDNLVWDFTGRGEGLRNTAILRGPGAERGALHWTANFDEVQDFEHDIRGPQAGTGFLPDAVFHQGSVDQTLGDAKAGLGPELDALAAYVNSVIGWGKSPLRRDSDPAWTASRARGAALFESAALGCRTCHIGSSFSDSGFDAGGSPRLHDVGTLTAASGQRLKAPLTGLDTPTLRGLWRSAPYLHDGSAKTLRDVLVAKNPADRHGAISTLSEQDLDDLEAYLMTLDDDEP
jgi:DNA-binding beta-propeller fold protein YncE